MTATKRQNYMPTGLHLVLHKVGRKKKGGYDHFQICLRISLLMSKTIFHYLSDYKLLSYFHETSLYSDKSYEGWLIDHH